MATWGAVLLAACGGSEPTSLRTSTPFPQSTPLSFPMQGVGRANATITGDVEVLVGSGAFTITVRLHGLPPGSSHAAQIRLGSCASSGPIDVPLQPLSADSAGLATSTTSVQRPYVIPPQGWYANVHQGPDLQGEQATPMACGDLRAA